ncbi:MAG: 2OG-Fe(II) oxygenase [Planctomycetes bacterium]|nr:2OG-Fe(II) oxygenase [Planctomycetota bacterium]
MRRGWLEKAIGLARRAAELAPHVATYRERMESYRSLADQAGARMVSAPTEEKNSRRDADPLPTDQIAVPSFLEELAGRLDVRSECHAAGQPTPTPILLKYGPGGFNALHRDLRGGVYFPSWISP